MIDSVSVAVAVIFSSGDLRQSDSTYVHLACLSGHSFFGTLPMVLSCLVFSWLGFSWLGLAWLGLAWLGLSGLITWFPLGFYVCWASLGFL